MRETPVNKPLVSWPVSLPVMVIGSLRGDPFIASVLGYLGSN